VSVCRCGVGERDEDRKRDEQTDTSTHDNHLSREDFEVEQHEMHGLAGAAE
jgi:hypothetical protein